MLFLMGCVLHFMFIRITIILAIRRVKMIKFMHIIVIIIIVILNLSLILIIIIIIVLCLTLTLIISLITIIVIIVVIRILSIIILQRLYSCHASGRIPQRDSLRKPWSCRCRASSKYCGAGGPV